MALIVSCSYKYWYNHQIFVFQLLLSENDILMSQDTSEWEDEIMVCGPSVNVLSYRALLKFLSVFYKDFCSKFYNLFQLLKLNHKKCIWIGNGLNNLIREDNDILFTCFDEILCRCVPSSVLLCTEDVIYLIFSKVQCKTTTQHKHNSRESSPFDRAIVFFSRIGGRSVHRSHVLCPGRE